MRKYATVLNQALGRRQGRTIKAYTYMSNTNGYSTTEASPATFTEVGNGVYYLEVTESFKATVGVVLNDGTFQVTNKGVWLEGDNEPTIVPVNAT